MDTIMGCQQISKTVPHYKLNSAWNSTL